MSLRPSLLAALRTGAAHTAARPGILAALLAANLLAAWVLAAPVRGVLAAGLDDNLYGETMRTGVSWRWLDTMARRGGELLGDAGALTAVVTDEGVRLKDLRRLSGPAVGLVFAGVLFFWMNSLFHCGFLATLQPGRGGGFVAATARFALPVSVLGTGALVSYVLVYLLLYVQTGKWLEDLRVRVDSEWVALGITWGRLAATAAALLAVKVLYDLVKVVLVERGTWNAPWAFLLALRELARRSGRYVLLYLLVGLGAPLLAGLWWLTGGRVVASGWPLLLLLFLLQQLFLTARIGLRLTHLAAARALFLRSQALAVRPPYKVEPAEGPGGEG